MRKVVSEPEEKEPEEDQAKGLEATLAEDRAKILHEVSKALAERADHNMAIVKGLEAVNEQLSSPAVERRPTSWEIEVIRDSDDYIESLKLKPIYEILN